MENGARTWNAWWNDGVRLVAIATWDEELLLSQARQLAEMREVPVWRWSRVSGLVRAGENLSGPLTRDPETMLDQALNIPAGVIVAVDLWVDGLSPRAVRILREIAVRDAPVMLLASAPWGTPTPASLERSVVKVTLGDPWGPRFRRWRSSREAGLAERVRRQDAESPGLESMSPAVNWSDVGGLKALKEWARQRQLALDEARGLPFPRGVLLYGIPGTGKSLSVKAWAGAWQLPLLRLNWAGLMARYVGQSEERLEAALKTAERLAPVILWLDEIDKAVGGGGRDNDGGVSRRLIGTLLTWLQEHPAPVLLLATANDIQGLPAELLRPGRFDALFFVDLPDEAARQEILAIHLRAHGLSPSPELLAVSHELTDFSGADIGAVVVEALFLSQTLGLPVTPDTLLQSSRQIIPWARTLGEELAERRRWAQGRLRQA